MWRISKNRKSVYKVKSKSGSKRKTYKTKTAAKRHLRRKK